MAGPTSTAGCSSSGETTNWRNAARIGSVTALYGWYWGGGCVNVSRWAVSRGGYPGAAHVPPNSRRMSADLLENM